MEARSTTPALFALYVALADQRPPGLGEVAETVTTSPADNRDTTIERDAS